MDTRRRRHFTIIALVAVVFLLFGDLAITSSRAKTTLQGGYAGNGEALHGASDLQILICREAQAGSAMAVAVTEALEKAGLTPARSPLRIVRLVRDRAGLDPDRPVFAVYRMKVRTVWTPFFSRSWASLEYGFASKASILPEPSPAVVMCHLDAPCDFGLRAELTLERTDWGLMTWPASRRLTREEAARQAVGFLLQALPKQDTGE
ncbi:MAG: hypothetical protein AB1645_08845 [Bacillota bacterium]